MSHQANVSGNSQPSFLKKRAVRIRYGWLGKSFSQFFTRKDSYDPKKVMKEKVEHEVIRAAPDGMGYPKGRGIWLVIAVLLCVNIIGFMFTIMREHNLRIHTPFQRSSLYLMDKAKKHTADPDLFEARVRSVARGLEIPPEWLMAVMYTESRFNPSVRNFKGSGATGLIQFMGPTLRDLNRRLGTRYYLSDLQRMTASEQMLLVMEYLNMMRERHGEFNSLTDLYLAILYPRAIGKHYSYTLFSHPSKRYRQNSGLDENKDRKITVGDIDQRMKRLYRKAYKKEKTYYLDS
ncbi:MAG: transglycosylase SLT domain-containing protein [Bacteroidota bacterium]